LGDLRNHIPILLHAGEIDLATYDPEKPLDTITGAVSAKISLRGQSRLPEQLNKACQNGRAILLLDGLDELPPGPLQEMVSLVSDLLKTYPSLRVVAAASPYHIDGLPALGFVPVPMASWDRRLQARFIQQWSDRWSTYVRSQDQEDYIDPYLLNGWLLDGNAAMTPLELTLKVWSAYAGDARGPLGTDAIEAYIRRMSAGVSKAKPAMEQLASQAIMTMRTSFTQNEAHHWVRDFDSTTQAESSSLFAVPADEAQPREISTPRVLPDLLRNGLLTTRGKNMIGFIHPVIMGYMAGRGISYGGLIDGIFSQPEWPLKTLAIHYLASQTDLRREVQPLLTDLEDPLHLGALTAGRWLRVIPPQADWRKVVLQHLSNLLQNEALPQGLRSRILAGLATANDPSVNALFHHLLKSPLGSVRRLAVLGLGVTRDVQSINDLIDLFGDVADVGQAVCMALVSIGTKPALDAVATILLQGAEELRWAAAEAFANYPEEGYPILREGSTMDDLLVRRAVIYGLRKVDEPWAITILEEMQIEEGQWVVRNAAAQVMEEITNIDPHTPQIPPQPEDLPWLISFASERGLGISPGKPARDMLLQVLREGEESEKLAALDYFRLHGDAGVFPAIYHLLYGSNFELREAAYNTLWHLAATGAEIPPPIQFGLG
jgi:HEAT repeat protein